MRFLAYTLVCVFCFLGTAGAGTAGTAGAAADQHARWQRHAGNVLIVRDNWGIAHIYGKTDAYTVFGTIYAQAEDDFSRIERNSAVRAVVVSSSQWSQSS